MTIPLNGHLEREGRAVPKHVAAAAALLLEAYHCARDLCRDLWDFAIEIGNLHAVGVTNNGLRWLLGKGYVLHAGEAIEAVARGRKFIPLGELILTPHTCFVLTEEGIAFTNALLRRSAPNETQAPVEPSGLCLVPVWDSDRQELRLGKVQIKQFKVPAPNQELILAAFQEEAWPPRIDDPLPPAAGLDAKRRLHETITSLNRNQKQTLISFHGDGSGQGVRWQFVESRRRSRVR